MAVRWYAALAGLASLVFLWFAADHAGLLRTFSQPRPEARLRTAELRSTWTIDLETGEQGTPQADVHWGMAARDQPYLGAYQRGAGPGALIAQASGARWEDLDEASLAKLSYASNRF